MRTLTDNALSSLLSFNIHYSYLILFHNIDMTYQPCKEITKKDANAELDEFIIFKGNLYTWSGGGQFGRAYHSVEPILIQGKYQKTLLKIMPYYDDDPYDKEHFDNEIIVQTRAAQYGLGPVIYESEKEITLHSSESSLLFPPNSPYCQYHKFNYILMEYYDISHTGGWKQLRAFELTRHSSHICKLIMQLIIYAKISIPADAASHFFYHPYHGYRMIDFGGSKPIETIDRNEHIDDLESNPLYGCANLKQMIKTAEAPSYGKSTSARITRSQQRKKPYSRGGKRNRNHRTLRMKRRVKKH